LATVKVCPKCGSTDRYPSGQCRPCKQKYQIGALQKKVCSVCGELDRYPSGACRVCAKGYTYLFDKPCPNCGELDRFPSGACKVCFPKRTNTKYAPREKIKNGKPHRFLVDKKAIKRLSKKYGRNQKLRVVRQYLIEYLDGKIDFPLTPVVWSKSKHINLTLPDDTYTRLLDKHGERVGDAVRGVIDWTIKH